MSIVWVVEPTDTNPDIASQDYWDAGSKNWADYHTKHHSDTYHEAH